MPEKSCFYWDILKIKRFKIASPPIYDKWDTHFRFFIYRNIKFSLERSEKKLTMKGTLNYEFKQYKSKFKQLNTIGS